MPETPRLAKDAYIYDGVITPKEYQQAFYPKAKKLKAYPYGNQTTYDQHLIRELCKALREVNKVGGLKRASLEQLSHVVCNYRYRALNRNPSNPSAFNFHYSCNKNYLRMHVSGMTEKLPTILTLMQKKGWVKDYRQSVNEGLITGKESAFHFTPAFVEFINSLEENNETKRIEKPKEGYRGREFQDDNFITIKINDPEQSSEENRGAIRTPADLNFNPKQAEKGRVNRTLKKYNKLIAETGFGLFPLDIIQDKSLITNELKEQHRDFDKYDFQDKLRVERQYADVYLNTYGRFHGGFWQSMPSKLRCFININNYQTVELDYGSMQPNILFAKAGAKPRFKDVYYVPFYDQEKQEFDPDKGIFERQLIKDCFMLLVNSKDPKNTFIRTILQRLRGNLVYEQEEFSPYSDLSSHERLKSLESQFKEWNGKEFRESLYISLQKAWEPIWDSLGADYNWRHLTKWDSDVAYAVIKKMTALNIPILTIHDSFIVQGNKAGDLYEMMLEAYEEVINPANNITPPMYPVSTSWTDSGLLLR